MATGAVWPQLHAGVAVATAGMMTPGGVTSCEKAVMAPNDTGSFVAAIAAAGFS
jgi:hypothetical protein